MNDRSKRRSYFCPDKYQPDDSLIEWATSEFTVTRKEVARQLMLMRDHEFRRPYSDWSRVFRNWLRKADDIQTFKRERKPFTTAAPEQTSEDRAEEQRKFEEQMKKWKVKI